MNIPIQGTCVVTFYLGTTINLPLNLSLLFCSATKEESNSLEGID